MTIVLSWNIQNGKGVDGAISLERIARVIGAMADPDVICLQEVSRGMPLGGGAPDQVAELGALFPAYRPLFGPALETASWAFGNLTLTRLPILSVLYHSLPQPPAPAVKHMPRQAIELNLQAADGPLRVVNTHLEYHSAGQRQAQIARLRAVHADVAGNRSQPPAYTPDGPYADIGRTERCVVCGDFNMETSSDEYAAMLAPFADGSPALKDAWTHLYPGKPHDPTCGIFDHVQWKAGAHCRDFFFVTESVTRAIKHVAVDTATDASDHQPLLVEF